MIHPPVIYTELLTGSSNADAFVAKYTVASANALSLTYSISANQSSINEGSTTTFTVTTTNVTSGTSLAYTLSGVSASDVTGGSLSGTTTVGSNGQATISVPIAADQTTEGTETLTVTVQGKSASTTIVDSSTTPTGTYALAASAASVNEGGTASFILTTTNVAAGTSLAYTITGVSASDLFSNSLSGSVSVSASGTTVISIPVLADNLTEGTETMTVSLQGKSASINILDTSTTPTPTYSISSNTSEVTEGSSFIVTLSTTNVPVGTVYPWAITSLNMTGRPSSADFDNGVTEGLVVVDNNGKAVVTLPVKADQLTEGYEDIYFSFYTDTTRTRVLANTAASIKDTSVGSATYSLVASSPTVSEGSAATFNVATTNVPTGSSLTYTITGVTASDLRDGLLTGSVVVGSNGQATVTVPIAADLTTEGNETLTVNLMGRTASVNIQDTSTDALRFTTPSPTVNEGDSVTVRVDALAVGIGPRIYYTIYGVSPEDFSQGTYGIDIDGGLIAGGGSGVNAFVNSGGTLTLPIANDQTTEGTETLTIRFSNGANGQSISFQILDTSKTPSYVVTSNQSSVSEGSSATFLLSTTNVAPGSSVTYTLSGISAADIVGGALSGNAVIASNGQASITVPLVADLTTEGDELITVTVEGKTATTVVKDTSVSLARYELVAGAKSVNEGESASFALWTANVPVGSQLTYTLSGISSSDIVGGSLQGTTLVGQDGKAMITVPIASDFLTEGAETLSVAAYGQSASVTVNDSSTSLKSIPASFAVVPGSKGFDISPITSATPPTNTGSLFVAKLGNAWTTEFRANADQLLKWFQGQGQLTGLSTSQLLDAADAGLTAPNQNDIIQILGLIGDADLRTGSPIYDGVFTYPTVVVQPPPSYELVAPGLSVNEGSMATFTLWTANVPVATELSYIVGGITAADVVGGALQGKTRVESDGRAFISVPLAADNLTEGPESLTVTIQGKAASMTVNDTSVNVQTDQTPPKLISVSPAIKSTAVAVNQDFVLLFDEGIKLGSVSFSLTSASGSLVAVQARIVGSQLTLDPLADLLEGTTYRLNLPKGSITDLVGNVFDGLFDFEITTAGSIGPPPGF